MMFTAAQLDSVLRSLLDKHAPMNNCKVSDKKCSLWYDNISDTLQAAKMSRRKAERRWRSSDLTFDKEIYDSTKKAVTIIVHNAKCAYYSAKIAESSNTKQLTRTHYMPMTTNSLVVHLIVSLQSQKIHYEK